LIELELFLTETYVRSGHCNFTLIELDPLLSAMGGSTCSYRTQVAPATISRWIVSSIKLAYQLTDWLIEMFLLTLKNYTMT
jgi:hypothetical protein